MKIFVRYFINISESKMLEIDVDTKYPLANISQFVSNFIKNNIVLFPVKINDISNGRTIEEYCKKTKNDYCDFNFTAVNSDCLTKEEKNILDHFSLNTLLTQIVEQHHAHDYSRYAQRFISVLQKFLPDEMQQSLVVRLADKTNMFGETYKDTLTKEAHDGESRYSVQVHPYPWLAAGASNVIIYRNIFNEISVALVYNQRRDRRLQTDPFRQAGIPDFLKLPEGYMHPKPCKGGEHGVVLVPPDDMDEAEELMLKGIPMQTAYKTIKEKKISSDHVSDTHAFDQSTKECATRECQEEVGLRFTIDQVQFVSQREENRFIPTIANVYLIKSKIKDIVPPTLTVDGIEIKEALWGKLRAFCFAEDNTKPENFRVTLDYYDEEGDSHPIDVPIRYVLMIGQAIKKLRDDEIHNTSQFEETSLFNSRENVEAIIKRILKSPSLNPQAKTLLDIVGAPPESNLFYIVVGNLPGNDMHEKNENLKALANMGKYADDYHRKILALSRAFTHMSLDKPLNADQLIAIANKGPEIESRLMTSKLTLFPLARLHDHTQSDVQKKQDTDSAPIPRFAFKLKQ